MGQSRALVGGSVGVLRGHGAITDSLERGEKLHAGPGTGDGAARSRATVPRAGHARAPDRDVSDRRQDRRSRSRTRGYHGHYAACVFKAIEAWNQARQTSLEEEN